MSLADGKVVVAGAGVVGVACAHYLQQAGLRVTLIDRGRVGGGCSHGNCGYICPSHVLPLAGPGVIGKTLWTLLQKDSPLTVRFRLDPALWTWFLRFALRCQRGAMLEAGHALAALLGSSRALYNGLLDSGGIEADWQQRGVLYVFRTPEAMAHHASTERLLREHFAIPARSYDGRQVVELEPALKPGLAGGWHYEGDAHLRPDQLMTSWKEHLQNKGVEIRENCALMDLERRGRQVQAVLTSEGRIPAQTVVVAAGAWTPLLSQQIGCRLPIQPGKGYSITMARPSRCPKIPILFEEDRVAITPFSTGYRIGSTMEFAGYDESLDRRRLDILRRAARLYLHEPEADPVQEEWWGWRPMVPDGKPVIGLVPGSDNLLVAAGHGMLGVSMAPATGKLVAELVTRQTPHVDPAPFSASRF